ncbi:MAG: CDP-alcohol phosphatidyltransferase family protein [Actinomycetota bacterium]|nr:CDP-alcohol phosphatidyltransferase family protein [Actinomycetota bacterium]
MTDATAVPSMMNAANAVTVARLVLTPLLIVLILDRGATWEVFALGMTIGLSDMLDGWLARRSRTTSSGAFLDPLADKVLVLGCMFTLVAEGIYSLVPVALIAGRELVISAYRSYWGRRGVSIPARRSAKLKTWFQGLAIALTLCPATADARWLWISLLWIAVAFTLVTGVQYLLDGSRSHETA